MSTLSVKPGKLPRSVSIPASKSYANRALVLAALKANPVTIHQLPASTDVTMLVRAFEQIGLTVQKKGSSVTVENSFPACELDSPPEISVGEGGTTGRFLAVLLLLGCKTYRLRLGPRLKQRPWEEFLTLAHSLGAEASLEDDLLKLRGPLKVNGDVKVDCTRTTQFATALELALAPGPHHVLPQNLDASESYWRMTQHLRNLFHSLEEFSVPLDWSSAAYPLVFGALNHPLFIPGLMEDEFQADAKLLPILETLGALESKEGGVRVHKLTTPQNLRIDVSDCLDLVPGLSFLLAHVPGRHVLSGISNLVHKESDRLQETIRLLAAFDRQAFASEDTLILIGHDRQALLPVHLELPDDHRMVMTAALFLRHHAGGTLTSAEAVAKSFPGFFELLSNF